MTEETKLIYDANHTYREGYEQGKADREEELGEIATDMVMVFIGDCGLMAEANWCPSQVEMLKRLFGAVLKGCEYADYNDEEKEDEEEQQA